jgi:hypothetical protein
MADNQLVGGGVYGQVHTFYRSGTINVETWTISVRHGQQVSTGVAGFWEAGFDTSPTGIELDQARSRHG